MSEHMLKYNGPVPEGYEVTGEVRPAIAGETYILYIVDGLVRITVCDTPTPMPVVIVQPKQWRPTLGETCWYVELGYSSKGKILVWRFLWEADGINMNLLESGNCFRTQEEAEAVAEKFRTIFKEAQK